MHVWTKDQRRHDMAGLPFVRSAARLATAATAISAAAYAAYVTTAWRGYGNPPAPEPDEQDEFLDQFMPAYDVVERHRIAVDAPPAVVLSAAKEQDLMQSPVVRAIFKARELALGASPDDRMQPRGLLATVRSLGWGVLAEREGREIVVGAVTKPWEPDVTFRALPPEQFAAYSEPGFVKIVWTLRADPVGEHGALFRTETRAIATDATARERFRKYWAFASPGISTIRWLSLRPLKHEAERRARDPAEE
jgi:hypothetical protein